MYLVLLTFSASFFLTQTHAYDELTISSGGKEMFHIQYFGVEDLNENTKSVFDDTAQSPVLKYTLTDIIKAGLNSSLQQWANILAPGSNNTHPVQYVVGTVMVSSADAKTLARVPNLASLDGLRIILQEGIIVQPVDINQPLPDEGYVFGRIRIGANLGVNIGDGNYGFVTTKTEQLPQEESGVGVNAVMFHEIGHSLGIVSSQDYSGDINKYGYMSSQFNDSISSWTAHLVDQYGNYARESQHIITSEEFNDRKSKDPTIKQSDFFIIDNLEAPFSVNSTIESSGHAFFVGTNVLDVLDGKTSYSIAGIPIKTWETFTLNGSGGNIYNSELSHIELNRSLMSHQTYRSYNTFMEAELAVMQDLGYVIDRKNYYGYSLYKDGQTITNSHGFSARNSDGTAYISGAYNTSDLGVGLHIYGSNNRVTQTADILTIGTGAAGIRIDGLQDSVTVARNTAIHADGENGVGVLVAYGRGHSVTIDGTVTANALNGSGNGVQFDYGSNAYGANTEYRGSYLRYSKSLKDGVITNSTNQGLLDASMTDPVNGDISGAMGNLYISGTLSGSQNAVYIAKNAFVDAITVVDGAEINGNITSEWKHFNNGLYDGGWSVDSEPLNIQYNGANYYYPTYIPDLVTMLTFNTTGDINYNGNITGSDNMKLAINSGSLYYSGNANVVNVVVAKDAALYGGNYTVNDMSTAIANGFSDETTGNIYNHGIIGAVSADTQLTIKGNLVSDGLLQAVGGGTKGNIVVSENGIGSGNANIDSAIVTATNILPGETTNAVDAATLTGRVQNDSPENIYASSGMLSTYGTVNGTNLNVTAVAANNLGTTNSLQNHTYTAISQLYAGLSNESKKNELRSLYSLNASNAKESLSAIGSNDIAPSLITLAQQSTTATRIVSSRVNQLSIKAKADLPIRSVDEQSAVDPSSREFQAFPIETTWAQFTKNWGALQNDVNYNSSGGNIGYDRQRNKYRSEGIFLSHEATNFSGTGSNARLKDTRLGIFSGYHKDATDAYIYVDYGWLKNRTHRNLSYLGLTANGDYSGHIFEIGGEYKYDLHANTDNSWHVSPYANIQSSYLSQNGYRETGAGILGQNISGKNNTYVALQGGVEFKRYLHSGSYAFRLGLQQALTGADPDLSFQYNGDSSNRYTIENHQDKTHVVLGIRGEHEFAKNWHFTVDAELKKGAHNHNIMAAAMVKYVW